MLNSCQDEITPVIIDLTHPNPSQFIPTGLLPILLESNSNLAIDLSGGQKGAFSPIKRAAIVYPLRIIISSLKNDLQSCCLFQMSSLGKKSINEVSETF